MVVVSAASEPSCVCQDCLVLVCAGNLKQFVICLQSLGRHARKDKAFAGPQLAAAQGASDSPHTPRNKYALCPPRPAPTAPRPPRPGAARGMHTCLSERTCANILLTSNLVMC